mmetsp:Transcript_15329/g.48929  ORF Transcript_15329/g.48929 Transcript_15329/m.48929 type:complete len:347 (-) Transcript_15329:183-1223(-)
MVTVPGGPPPVPPSPPIPGAPPPPPPPIMACSICGGMVDIIWLNCCNCSPVMPMLCAMASRCCGGIIWMKPASCCGVIWPRPGMLRPGMPPPPPPAGMGGTEGAEEDVAPPDVGAEEPLEPGASFMSRTNASLFALIACSSCGFTAPICCSTVGSVVGLLRTMVRSCSKLGSARSAARGSPPLAPPDGAAVPPDGAAAPPLGALMPSGRPDMRYSTARSGLLYAARNAARTWSSGNPMSHRFRTVSASASPVTMPGVDDGAPVAPEAGAGAPGGAVAAGAAAGVVGAAAAGAAAGVAGVEVGAEAGAAAGDGAGAGASAGAAGLRVAVPRFLETMHTMKLPSVVMP